MSWKWCTCTRDALRGVKCAHCHKPLYTASQIVEALGSHWHTECVLDRWASAVRTEVWPPAVLG